jgi:hypothetical protein
MRRGIILFMIFVISQISVAQNGQDYIPENDVFIENQGFSTYHIISNDTFSVENPLSGWDQPVKVEDCGIFWQWNRVLPIRGSAMVICPVFKRR